MVDSEKRNFWAMINLTMELCNRPPLSKEAVVAYWNLLCKYDFEVVRKALDAWVDSSTKAPTPKDIKDLCMPKGEIYVAIAPIRNEEIEIAGLQKINRLVRENMKPKTDHKAWAKRIMANPSAYLDIAVKYAKEALYITDTREIAE